MKNLLEEGVAKSLKQFRKSFLKMLENDNKIGFWFASQINSDKFERRVKKAGALVNRAFQWRRTFQLSQPEVSARTAECRVGAGHNVTGSVKRARIRRISAWAKFGPKESGNVAYTPLVNE